MFDLTELFIDSKAGAEGVWVPFYQGSKLKIASTESSDYKRALSQLAKKHRIELDDTNPDSFELIQQITTEALSKHVLKDWKGIHFGDDKNVSYNPEKGQLALLSSPAFRDFVLEKAKDPATFRPEPAVNDAKIVA